MDTWSLPSFGNYESATGTVQTASSEDEVERAEVYVPRQSVIIQKPVPSQKFEPVGETLSERRITDFLYCTSLLFLCGSP